IDWRRRGMVTTTGCEQDVALERMRFYPRQLLGADDLRTEQDYFREKLRRHNRFLHGWGVVCGCDVKPDANSGAPWRIRICPGYVLSPQGDEILISAEATFDLATCFLSSTDPCAFARPCPPISRVVGDKTRQKLYVAVRYAECQS